MSIKNILFVDDDENVINGIQRQLRPYRAQWKLFSANTGSQALQLMSEQPIGLIVSDMMMPEMRGDELLKKVSELYPGTVRIILSGYADEETLKSGFEVAHQYLRKPCSSEDLREAISQIFKIQACLRNPLIVAEIGDASQLPSLPKIYLDLKASIAGDNIAVSDIANIVGHDMVLSAKLLHLVNSPYFGFNRLISSLPDAINLIGLEMFSNLVLSVHVKNSFPVKDLKMKRYMELLWQDATRVAELARLVTLAENQREDRPDQAYLGGLLHNMGLLIFLSRGGNKLNNLTEQINNTNTPIAELETAIFGFTRSEAAAYVLSLWKIPPRIIEAILLQNTPIDTDYDGINALTAVHVAACLLKPSVMTGCNRLFEMTLDTAYLQRINKLERLPYWQTLADKVMAC